MSNPEQLQVEAAAERAISAREMLFAPEIPGVILMREGTGEWVRHEYEPGPPDPDDVVDATLAVLAPAETRVYLAPLDATGDPLEGWVEVGHLTEDGLTFLADEPLPDPWRALCPADLTASVEFSLTQEQCDDLLRLFEPEPVPHIEEYGGCE